MKNNKKKILNEEQQTYMKALYNIKPQLKQNYKKLSKTKQRIFICCYNIQSNEGFDQSFTHLQNKPKKDRFGKPKKPKFFLLYLLFKYSKKNNDIMIFPFDDNPTNTEPLITANNLIKKVIKKTQTANLEGYIENKNGIFFFYNITYNKIINIGIPLKSSDQLWYCLIDEICNYNNVLNFPVHKSVFNLFYQNPDLIYLKYKNEKLSIPVVAYQGLPRKKLGIQLMFRRSDQKSALGHYPSLYMYNEAFRDAIWEKRYIAPVAIKSTDLAQKKVSKVDDFNRFITSGAIIRYAVFLGKKRWHIMYQNSDPFIKIIKAWDIKIDNLKQLEQYVEEREKLSEWWPQNFDSLSMGMIRMKNISMHLWPLYRSYILRKTSQMIPLGYSIVNNNNDDITHFWDPKHKYNIV